MSLDAPADLIAVLVAFNDFYEVAAPMLAVLLDRLAECAADNPERLQLVSHLHVVADDLLGHADSTVQAIEGALHAVAANVVPPSS